MTIIIIIITGSSIIFTVNCNHRTAATLGTLELVPTQPAVHALSPCFAFCGTRKCLLALHVHHRQLTFTLCHWNILILLSHLLFISFPQSDFLFRFFDELILTSSRACCMLCPYHSFHTIATVFRRVSDVPHCVCI
jgi:hypothetical protein